MTNKTGLELLDWAETLLCQPEIPKEAVKKWRDEKNELTTTLRNLEQIHNTTEKLFGRRDTLEQALGKVGALYDELQLMHKAICEKHEGAWGEYNDLHQQLIGNTPEPTGNTPEPTGNTNWSADYLLHYTKEVLAAIGVEAKDSTQENIMLKNICYFIHKACNETR